MIRLLTARFVQMSAYWIDYGMSFVNNPAQWKLPLALQVVFAIFTVALILFCPESPRWLLKHGKEEEARAVLDQLSVLPPDGRAEILESNFIKIKETLVEEEAATLTNNKGEKISNIRACFTNGKDRYFHRVMLGVGSQFMQQLCVSRLEKTLCKITVTDARLLTEHRASICKLDLPTCELAHRKLIS